LEEKYELEKIAQKDIKTKKNQHYSIMPRMVHIMPRSKDKI
jgi:hypothetical protein